MKRVGILTYHNADNLGAVLQAYALQTVLEESFSIPAEIIDYRCNAIEETKYKKRDGGIVSFLKAVPKAGYYLIKRIEFQHFRREFLKCSPIIYYPENIAKCNETYEIFITGSDQVWNPECSGWDDAYFLSFVMKDKMRISYAASMGKFRFPETKKQYYHELLSCFDRISVREKSAVAELLALGITNVKVCPDPVILLPREQWMTITPRRICKRKYVLVYLVLPDQYVISCAEAYAKQHGCLIINNKKSMEFILHNSPSEFLSWICYAECVFTNSFHGTALSLIYNKPLGVEVNMHDGAVNNRVNDLLNSAGAQACIMHDKNGTASPVNVEDALSQMRESGMEYLHEIFGGM